MIENFERYFLHEKKVFLDNVRYETAKPGTPGAAMKLNCKDTILAQLTDSGVRINFNRTLGFEPEGLFALSVTFGVSLVFDPSTKNEVDWKSVDIAGEFRRGCPALMTVLMSRTSHLIAEITSASGQVPLVTPSAPPAPGVPQGTQFPM